MRIWIAGPIAWDSVLYINNLPKVGAFTHAKKHDERPGGQALNISIALKESGFETGLVGYVGNDEYGKQLLSFAHSKLSKVEIKVLPNPTPHVVVLVDENGDRTMIGMEKSFFGEISLNLSEINSEDVVVWPIWREPFTSDLKAVQAKGCRTIVGLGAINSGNSADIAIGSSWELASDFDHLNHLNNFPRIIVTNNSEGAIEFSQSGIIKIPAERSEVIDTTGAGDAFLCGIIKGLIENRGSEESMKIASKWSALAVAAPASIPPKWS